ncbi:PF03729 repeat protein [Jonquetella sp. BV3C21]|uniref:HdeD family acid-resistance protein n=1 Tax=Jonquetella anthropi DSM 22815 TaxID=885272 RepID=H0UJ56_9BACT|nr:hypothetical protein JonanDRAFT_0371 [Jonquetella anthropi DSM 22815]ERL24092.1 PF03729 repeat protein [Jonquetella sp. BV3C21]
MLLEKLDVTTESVKALQRQAFFVGSLMVFLGCAVWIVSLVFSVAFQRVAGVAVLLAAGAEFALSFRSVGTARSVGRIFAAVLTVLGAIMVFLPEAGAATLSVLIALYFIADGVMRLVSWWRVKAVPGAWGLLVGGIISAVLAVIILSNWLGARTGNVPRVLLGAMLVISGLLTIRLALGCTSYVERRASEQKS